MDKNKSNTSPKPKFRKRNNNWKSKKDDFKVKDTKTEAKDNDPKWYLMNGQLAKDVANFSFNNATGDVMVFNPNTMPGSADLPASHGRMPGIASILTGPTPGVAVSATSPINVAARNIYSFVRHANSGHSNYDPNDLMTYLLAMDSIQTYWSYLVRMYGVAQTFQQRNRYIGDALIAAMGGDPQSIRENICELRAYINQYAIQASVLAVPNTMTYYLRHAWMYQNVYCDEDNPKAQLFMYVPAYVYEYTILDNGAGGLRPLLLAVDRAVTGAMTEGIMQRSFATLKMWGDRLLDSVLSQEDVGIMSGDILKAYGSDKLYRFNQIDESYAIAPVFSEEVLAQFHNLSMGGRRPAYLDTSDGSGVYRIDCERALEVRQDNAIGRGLLEHSPALCNAIELCYTTILDLWQSDITPDMALVASRNKMFTMLSTIGVVSLTGQVLTNYGACVLETCGSEIVFDVTVFYYDDNGQLTSMDVNPHVNTGYNTGVVAYTTKFNQFPLLRGTPNKNSAVTFPVGEVSNYALLNFQDVAPMHSAALLSMFGVPYQW